MARRISVVLSQAPAAGADSRQLDEALIAELMFEQGIDASVVPHLARLTEGTTGLLCLEGIKGDFVLLTWMEPDTARTMLAQRGIRGRVGRTLDGGSGEEVLPEHVAASPFDRKIYILQLQAGSSTTHYLREIRRIRDEAQLRTFGLEPLGSSPASEPAPNLLAEQPGDSPAASTAATRRGDRQPERSPSSEDRADQRPADGGSRAAEKEAAAPAPTVDELDQLLDQLDALDL